MLYGCVAIVHGLLCAGVGAIGASAASTAAASVRAQEGAADLPNVQALLEVLDGLPAMMLAARPWDLAAAAAGVLCVVTGWGVLRRSAPMRTAAIAFAWVSFAVVTAGFVHDQVVVRPQIAASARRIGEIMDELRRNGAQISRQIRMMVQSSETTSAIGYVMRTLHLAVVVLLTRRLLSAPVRSWCDRGPGEGPLGDPARRD